MSLPPGFLEDLRSRLSLAQVVGRKVAWDLRKSNQGKGDMWAPCPFHQEKSASFHVDDRKGYYYCFGCHAKGDAISFVRETENVSFVEAVEILAREAGLPIPARDPEAAARAGQRTQLSDVMELAVQFYRLQLQTQSGAAARAYLARRGLSPEAIARWDIGFAPDDRGAVLRHLQTKGIAPDMAVEAGLCARPEGGGAPYDRFRDRIIFPIRDARGRAISLGGRAMDPAARAKYLNGPETPIFDKGRALFNLQRAREAAGKGQRLILAEGYMDVIALSEAGFTAAVAPLGTAVTEDQLALAWRLSPEPIIALDGDRAGQRAALRVVDLALPLLESGRGLRFALMPAGQDPDELIKAKGAPAMQAVLDAAQPMVRLLWARETEGRDFDSPERKAALDKVLRAAIARIKDPSIRAHYGDEIKALRWELFGARRRPSGASGAQRGLRPARGHGGRFELPPAPPQASTRASALAASGRSEDLLHEAVILATLLVTPAVLPEFEGPLDALTCTDPGHEAIRRALLRHAAAADPRAAVAADLGEEVLASLMAEGHVRLAPGVLHAGQPAPARLCLAEELAKLNALRGHARELEDAMEDLEGSMDEGLTWRLAQAAQALDRARRGDTEDRTEYETGPNGARINRDERSALDRLLGGIDFGRGGRRGRD